MIRENSKTVLEYIWLGGTDEIRSKTRVVNNFLPFDHSYVPEWNYDGSSTFQANSDGDTEIILKPCALFKDPTRFIENTNCYLVLCETYNSLYEPLKNNHRYTADMFFEENDELEPWFGLEQEYFINLPRDEKNNNLKDGYHYCGRVENPIERIIAEQHLQLCLEAGLKISGINSEVSRYQWEFQIGPCEGISAADELIIARYLLQAVAEKFHGVIDYHPKPITNINGSGCHINFSNRNMRINNGIDEINKCIKRLENKHKETIQFYGESNHLRLTGLHETSSYDKFSWGVGTRNTSIRIPNCAMKDITGSSVYFEDRRPAANIDPYKATFALFRDACFDSSDV